MPPTSGSCDQDQFVVSGQNTNHVIPIICGINTGQHGNTIQFNYTKFTFSFNNLYIKTEKKHLSVTGDESIEDMIYENQRLPRLFLRITLYGHLSQSL